MIIIENNYTNLLCNELKKYNLKKIFVVCGKKSFASSGLERDLNEVFAQIDVEQTFVFSDFSPNPQYEDLQKGLKELHLANPDCIIGAGGGSAMDMAKLLRFFYTYQGNIETNGPYSSTGIGKTLPLVCLPSTSGTGAEVTHFAVIYKDGIKYSASALEILPDIAVIAPKYTYKNNAFLTACTGFDALSQAIESFWNIKSTPISEELALRAIKKIFHTLPKLIYTPTNELRDELSKGSVLAGQAINITQTTAPHAYSYFLTSKYDVPHGQAVAFFFPYFFKWNLEAWEYYKKPEALSIYQEKTKKLLDCLGVENQDKELFFAKYINSLGLSLNIGSKGDIEPIISAVNIVRLQNNPMDINTHSLRTYLNKTIG